MARYFNTEGRCRADLHYMVRIDDMLDKIKRLFVDRGKYFIINRGRQYGKTTTLMALAEYLKNDYTVLPMDFQAFGADNFADGQAFSLSFIEYIEEIFSRKEGFREAIDREAYGQLLSLKEQGRVGLDKLFRGLSRLCDTAEKPVVLMIDEVDSAANNQVFVDFLAQLRRYYLDRENNPIFYSVILAGVYDVKNLKLKLRPDEGHQYNSPWNIAAKFELAMEFSAEQISGMLAEYEEDAHTGMDVNEIAAEIYRYTAGYPYLVSAICKILDEELPYSEKPGDSRQVWTRKSVAEAVKLILKTNIPLFDSMIKQIDLYKELRVVLEQIIYQGRQIPFSPAEKAMNLGLMFGYLKERDGHVVIANRIFEMYLLNWFITQEAIGSNPFHQGERNKSQFIAGGRLNMERVLEKFVEYFHDVYGENSEEFVENCGRKYFLLYLKPIINGTGNYYLEAQTRDARRTDVIVDYLGEQFIVEMKIWHGNEYNERGEKQLAEYLEYYHLKKGYMLSFNFNRKKETGVKAILLGDKQIVEAVV